MSNKIKAYAILQKHGFDPDDARDFLEAMENDETNLATKGDLNDVKVEIHKLKAEFHKELNAQTMKFLGILITLGTIFKLVDVFIHFTK